ncbi:hypothetical protein KAR91_61165, partial [Candidatus Pacearchaeota archaeon]|nr:hypothetical protein [Candidatus Pacearchaeota archaeon]
TPLSQSAVQGFVMPIMLDGGEKWDRKVPFSMLSEAQAQENHGQTLKRLADRGGLAPSEAIAIINGGGWKPVSDKIGLEILTHRLDGETKA